MNIDFEKIYHKYNVSNSRIKHMNEVAKICIEINKQVKLKVDKKALISAALLHDIGSSYYKGKTKNEMSDFEFFWGHQLKTYKWLIRENLEEIAEIAARHNAYGLNPKDAKDWKHNEKIINLLPNSNESKILAFADSFRKKYVTEEDCVTIKHKDIVVMFKKYKFLKKATERKKKLFKFLVKNGLKYEKLYRKFIV